MKIHQHRYYISTDLARSSAPIATLKIMPTVSICDNIFMLSQEYFGKSKINLNVLLVASWNFIFEPRECILYMFLCDFLCIYCIFFYYVYTYVYILTFLGTLY